MVRWNRQHLELFESEGDDLLVGHVIVVKVLNVDDQLGRKRSAGDQVVLRDVYRPQAESAVVAKEELKGLGVAHFVQNSCR